MRKARLLSVVVLAPAMMLFAPASPASPGSPATCEFNAGVGLVTATIGEGTRAVLRRDGRQIELNGLGCVDGAIEATVDNTDVINMIGSTGSDYASIDLRGGMFGPGLTDEIGDSDEIEIVVNLLQGGRDRLEIVGRNRRDTIVLGTLDGSSRVNLNAREGDTIDYDLSVNDNVEQFYLYGLGGNDTMSATGGSGTGAVLLRGVGMLGQNGNDTLTGGAGPDRLDDCCYTPRGDTDLLFGKGGDDRLNAEDGDGRDRAIGGIGSDRCPADRGDTRRSC